MGESYFAACIRWSKLPAGTNRLKTEVSALNCLQPPQTFMLYSGDSIISKYRNQTKHTKLSKEQDFFHVYHGSRKAAMAGWRQTPSSSQLCPTMAHINSNGRAGWMSRAHADMLLVFAGDFFSQRQKFCNHSMRVFFPLICPMSFLNLYNILACPVLYSKVSQLTYALCEDFSPPEHGSVIWCSVFLYTFSEFTKASLTLHRLCQTHIAARERTWGFISIFAQTFWETVAVSSQDHTLLILEISKGVERHSWYKALHKGLALAFLQGIKTSSEFIKASLKSQNLYLFLSLVRYEVWRKSFCALIKGYSVV